MRKGEEMCYTAIWRSEDGSYYTSTHVGSADRPTAWKNIQRMRGARELVMLVLGHQEVFVQPAIDITT